MVLRSGLSAEADLTRIRCGMDAEYCGRLQKHDGDLLCLDAGRIMLAPSFEHWSVKRRRVSEEMDVIRYYTSIRAPRGACVKETKKRCSRRPALRRREGNLSPLHRSFLLAHAPRGVFLFMLYCQHENAP